MFIKLPIVLYWSKGPILLFNKEEPGCIATLGLLDLLFLEVFIEEVSSRFEFVRCKRIAFAGSVEGASGFKSIA